MKKQPIQDTDFALLLLRLVVGSLLLIHGIDKIRNGVGGLETALVAKGLPEATVWGIYVGQLLAPLLLILGFMTRPAGLVVTVTMGLLLWLDQGAGAFSGGGVDGGLSGEVYLFHAVAGMTLFCAGAGRLRIAQRESRWH